LTFVNDGATALARYWYNGIGQVVSQQYDQPDVMWNLYGSAGTYPDLDRFNRVVSSRWTKVPAVNPAFDFYSVALTYDRNSNITSADDSVHAGFDVAYTMDSVNRLTRAEEGTLGSGTISNRKRDEQWTLNHTGNWDRDKVDLNGDTDFVDANELDDTRTHNAVNELTARDTDSNASNNYTLSYDGSGDLTDDGQSYKYEYDAFLRLRKVKNQSNALVAEYRYNGLGHRIAVHEDTDTDGDVDANDKWYYDAFDERWRHLARFRESDSSPKEDFVPHQAGLDGNGASSYIDLVVCRNKDANTAWTSASDGTLEERIYHCQNWRADVSAIVAAAGTMKEWDKYSAYGIPFGLPGGDTDSDGDCDSTDVTQVQTWINGSQYNVRGDIDLDGDVDSNDKSTINGSFSGLTLGRGSISTSGTLNLRGFAGYEVDAAVRSNYNVRNRVYATSVGRWMQRDPKGYINGYNIYAYCDSNPYVRRDPSGLDYMSCIEDCRAEFEADVRQAHAHAKDVYNECMETLHDPIACVALQVETLSDLLAAADVQMGWCMARCQQDWLPLPPMIPALPVPLPSPELPPLTQPTPGPDPNPDPDPDPGPPPVATGPLFHPIPDCRGIIIFDEVGAFCFEDLVLLFL
jgi:RHS repeat-associated protein